MSELITSFAQYRSVVSEALNLSELSEGRKSDTAAEFNSTDAQVRTKVLGFIAEKGSVSKQDLMEFFATVDEELGKKPSWSWLRKNSHLIDTELDESGETVYSLTKRGLRVLEVYKNYEKLSSEFAKIQEEKTAE